MGSVLLVDDNEVQAGTRKLILARAGHDVRVAHSATTGLSVLESRDYIDSVGLVITDHFMPAMNGPEFIRRLRRLCPHLPVLVLSGLLDAEGEYAGLEVIFRVKPFAPDQLVALVKSLLTGPISRTA